ncbi:MAG: DNA internalization-related competence protein ComEC/Rec2 [Desulfobulbaceae bacterium]
MWNPIPMERFDSFLKNNLLPVITAGYVIGAAAAKRLSPAPEILPWLTLVTGLFVLLVFLLRRRKSAPPLLLLLFVFAGLLHTAHGLLPPGDPHHLYNLLPERSRVTLTGTVRDMPEFDGEKTRFNLEADSLLIHEEAAGEKRLRPARGTVRLTLEGTLPPEIRPGSTIMVLTRAGRTSGYRTPGVFDYRLHLAEKGIHVTGRIESPAAILPFRDSVRSPWKDSRFLPERFRQKTARFLAATLDERTGSIYQALLIGSRATIPDDVLEQFKASGTMHLLAISGLHMGLLGLMITVGLTWVLKRSTRLLLRTHVPTIATLGALAPLICYGFIAGLNTPVLRALLMSVLFLVGIVLQRRRSLLPIVAGAALLMLTWKPLALFTVSFQLSFASVLAIAFMYPRLLRRFENAATPGGTLRATATSMLLVSLAATIGTLPFMLFHFNRVSLVGPVANLLVEPLLCFWALPFGLVSLVAQPFLPDVAALLLKTGSLGIAAADRLTGLFARLPFSDVHGIVPTPWEMIGFYLLLFLWFFRHRIPRALPLVLTGLLLLAFSYLHGLWFPLPTKTAEISYLDVGQGSSTFVRLPGGHTLLIDAGAKTSPGFDVGERIIAPYLRKKRIWRLDDIILTHPHSDHVNGLGYLSEQFSPRRIWINGDRSEEKRYHRWLDGAAHRGTRIIKPQTGRVVVEEGGEKNVLTFIQGAEPPVRGIPVNDRSLVIRLDIGEIAFLFPGDIGRDRERLLVERGARLRADVLLAPHHGARGSGSASFIAAVDPSVIVVSAGRSPARRYPWPGHLANWREKGIQVLTTGEAGTVTCFTDGTTLRIPAVMEPFQDAKGILRANDFPEP